MKPVELTYGSDKHGLVWGYLFAPGYPGREIGTGDVMAYLASPAHPADGKFLWLHFSLSNAATALWLREHLDLPSAFFDSLRGNVGSTTLEQEAEALVAVIHDVLFDTAFDTSGISTASICLQSRLLISARIRPLRSIDRLRAAVKSGQAVRSATDLLAHLLRDQASVLADILRQSTTRIDTIEDALLARRTSASRGELGGLRRTLVRLQRLLAPEPAALFRLLSRPPVWIGEDDLQELRQSAEEFSVTVGDTAALVERVKLLQEELGASVNEQTNRTLFVLTTVTVLALPINLVAGLFGMNVGGIPLSNNDKGFWLIVGTLATLTALLVYLAIRRRRD